MKKLDQDFFSKKIISILEELIENQTIPFVNDGINIEDAIKEINNITDKLAESCKYYYDNKEDRFWLSKELYLKHEKLSANSNELNNPNYDKLEEQTNQRRRK